MSELKEEKNMKNKIVPTIYRIFMILTFLCGSVMMYWFGKFAVYAIEDEELENVMVASSIGNFGYFFFAFLMMVFICFIFSIVCFKAAKPVASVFRTLFTAVSGIICVPAVKLMLIFVDIKRFYVDNIASLDYVKDIDIESEVYYMFLPLPAYAIILVLFVTSVIALAIGPVIREEKDTAEPSQTAKKDEKKSAKKAEKKTAKK